jgi:coenzyme F420-dependent glucose-6-phosphate dehydrogenase
MAETRYWMGCAHEQFPPEDLLQQAVEAEQAGFAGIACSDHFQPWWTPGHSGHAWVWLGAVAAATKEIELGTGVTPVVHRYHPAVVAQAWATLERLAPGRSFLGVGSGESLNETPTGMDWPSVAEQQSRMEESLDVITRLWDGETVSHDGWFRAKDAKLHTNSERRPPLYVSAFGPEAAQVAGRYGDGLWTLADPENAPEVIDAYRSAAEDAGREPGEIILHTGFSWAEDDDAALAGGEVWKGAQPDEYYTDDWHDPDDMLAHGREEYSDEDLKEAFILSSDPEVHADRIREIEKLGATVVVCMNISGADPHRAIEVYGEKVLPALTGARA